MKIAISPLIQPTVCTVELPPPSKHRSARVWKKLMKRVRLKSKWLYTEGLVVDGVLYVHPTAYEEIRKNTIYVPARLHGADEPGYQLKTGMWGYL